MHDEERRPNAPVAVPRHGRVEDGDILGHEFMGFVEVPGIYAGFIHAFFFGDAFEKGAAFCMGQTHVQPLMPELLAHIAAGRLRPEAIISHRLSLEEAAEGYRIFNEKEDRCRKVVLQNAHA
jgi:threonine dehydrogenase-like Zn-dependent dehydrogenase